MKGDYIMKTYVDKDMTTIAQAAKVREDLKEFKARYTDGDLKRFFLDQTNTTKGYCSRIVEATVTGFPGGAMWGDATMFCVNLLLDSCDCGIMSNELIKIRYYCDIELNVDMRDLSDGSGRKLYQVKVYA